MAKVDIEKLRRLIVRLRSPDGCPWDREQTLESVRAYLVEEAHEAAAAIDDGERSALCEELGDLLFQVVFVAQLAEEEGAFDLEAVVDGIHAKMIERHPHVFGDDKLKDAAAVNQAWQRRKLERQGSAQRGRLLEGLPPSLPALTTALRMTQKASGVGFDWASPGEVLEQVREELAEVDEAVASGDRSRCMDEIGDLLFSVVNLARHLDVDPEIAMARANGKFKRRFGAVEESFDGREGGLVNATLLEMEEAWQEAKRLEAQSTHEADG